MPISTFLNASPVSQLRGIAWLALSDSGHVGTSTVVDDTGGGAQLAWTYGSAVPCRVDPLAGDERVIGARLSDRSTYVITVPPGLAVRAENRFVVDGRGTFEVTAVQERTGELMRFVEAVELT